MTTHIGDHVHPIDRPDLDLVIDTIAPQGAASAWFGVHDPRGRRYYVEADQTIPHGRHRQQEPSAGTVCGLLATPTVWPAPAPWRRTDRAHELACRIGDVWEQLVALFAVAVLFVLGACVIVLVTAALWPIQPNAATGVGALGFLGLGIAMYLLFTYRPSTP